MTTNTSSNLASFDAMAFFHADGLVPAWTQAATFAGEGGRLATLPDIIEARLATKPGMVPWEMYFTTTTAEYYGVTRRGTKVLAVAHGVGPMANLGGAVEAYRYEFQDKERRGEGGRIPQALFWKLLDGGFGEVSVVELETVLAFYEHPFHSGLTPEEALEHPLVAARLGGVELAERYIARHAAEAAAWRAKEFEHLSSALNLGGEDRGTGSILSLGKPRGGASYDRIERASDTGNLFSVAAPVEDGVAVAHLLSIGQLVTMGRNRVGCLESDVGTHSWNDGTRFVGLCAGAKPGDIHRGIDTRWALRKARDLLLCETGQPNTDTDGFHTLMPLGEEWFTQVPKRGVALDTGEPEFQVTAIEPVGEPKAFFVDTAGYYGYFKYGVNEVRKVAPAGVNAYALVGDVRVVHGGESQFCTVQFYRVTVDRSKRLLRDAEVCKDFDLMMRIAVRQKTAA